MKTIDKIYSQFKRKYKKALVTGGAGFIGSHICEELVTRGFPVISIDDYSAGKRFNLKHLKSFKNFTEVKCDITDQKRLTRYFKGVDIVFHNAASKKSVCLIDPRRDLQVNGGGAFNLLDLAVKHRVKKFVHASTGSVYGEPVYFPTDEKHPTNPVSFYGTSKLAAEKYVQIFHQLYGLNTTILRYFHVYGNRQEFSDYGGVISIFTSRISEGKRPTIYGTGRQERSFTYVKDVVKANLLAASEDSANGQIYNCASAIKITINDLCHFMLKAFNHPNLKPIYKDWLVGDIKEFNIDNSKIKKLGMDFTTDFYGQLAKILEEMKVYVQNAPKRQSPQTKKNLRRF